MLLFFIFKHTWEWLRGIRRAEGEGWGAGIWEGWVSLWIFFNTRTTEQDHSTIKFINRSSVLYEVPIIDKPIPKEFRLCPVVDKKRWADSLSSPSRTLRFLLIRSKGSGLFVMALVISALISILNLADDQPRRCISSRGSCALPATVCLCSLMP